MMTKRQTQISVLSLGLCLVMFAAIFSGLTTRILAATQKGARVAIGLDGKATTKGDIVAAIKSQLNGRNVSASETEVQQAATNALNLVNQSKDPQKGVIYVNTKKFTICISWGRQKAFCDSH